MLLSARVRIIALCTFAALSDGGGASVAQAASAATTNVPTIPLDQIRAGMKGYGLTVIRGTRPEKFDVEVVGVLSNFHGLPGLILVKVSHPRLDITKNVKGMSGSPIYLEGKLAGAYAYSPASFQVEPIAGVTPIAPMLTEMHRPIAPGFWPLQPRAASVSGDAAASAWSMQSATIERARLHVAPEGFVSAGTAMGAAGLSPRSLAYANEVIQAGGYEALADGGFASSSASASATSAGDVPAHFENGSAIGVSYVRGDISMAGIGTVTHVEGNKLCAFGHPMMSAGTTAFPTGIANIEWIYASAQHSFKMGNIVRPLGALVQDRLSAIVVDEHAVAPEFPMQVKVMGATGAPKTTWSMTVTEDSFMAPMIAATALGNALEATVTERRDVSWKLHAWVKVEKYGEVELEDVGIASGGLPEAGAWASSKVVKLLGETLNNPWEHLRVQNVRAEFTVAYVDDVMRVRDVEALDTVVEPGSPVHLRVHYEQKYTQKRHTQDMMVNAPLDVADKDIEFEVAPGYSVKTESDEPESMRDVIRMLTAAEAPARSVVVQRAQPGSGVLHHGHKTDVLPAFALDALKTERHADAPGTYIVMQRRIFPTDRYVVGRGKVSVRVRTKKP